MNSVNKKVIAIALVLVMILGSFSLAFASESPDITPYNTGIVSIAVERLSNTSGESIVDCMFNAAVSSATCTMLLQEKSGTSWVTATGVSPTTQTVSNDTSVSLYTVNRWNLTAGKNYRIKVTIKDTTNTGTYTNVYYSPSF